MMMRPRRRGGQRLSARAGRHASESMARHRRVAATFRVVIRVPFKFRRLGARVSSSSAAESPAPGRTLARPGLPDPVELEVTSQAGPGRLRVRVSPGHRQASVRLRPGGPYSRQGPAGRWYVTAFSAARSRAWQGHLALPPPGSGPGSGTLSATGPGSLSRADWEVPRVCSGPWPAAERCIMK
jgi:hypothetical protein